MRRDVIHVTCPVSRVSVYAGLELNAFPSVDTVCE